MSYRSKMIIYGILFFGGVGLFAANVPTFGRRCAAFYEPKSSGYERCVDRLATGSGVHFTKRVVLEPVVD